MADGREQTATEVAARRIDDTRGDALRHVFYSRLASFRARGLILDYEFRAQDLELPNRCVLELSVLELRLPFAQGRLLFSINEHELSMGGMEALRFWLETIERDLLSRQNEWRLSRLVASPGPVAAIGIPEAEVFRRYIDAIRDGLGYNEKADTKAKELFVSVAGQDAYETLEAGKPLPLKGSAGTDYRLFRRATYCIERPSDGARLCAVVPGVPMYDHLLGIKLIVEHDEPAFLRAANVAAGTRNTGRLFQYSRAMQASNFNPDMYGYGP